MRHLKGIEIVYEDDDVIVINKPAGLLTCATRHGERMTVEEVLSDYVRKGQWKSRRRVWLVHRLDRETSGIMMVAKSEDVQDYFRSRWNEITVKKYYALVSGTMADSEGVFESYLKEDDDGYKVRSVPKPSKVNPAVKFSRTEWRKIWTEDGVTLVEVTLKSGRKNQIRVHFSEAGHPVVGDCKYGKRIKNIQLCLHSSSLEFLHPHDDRRLSFTVPSPKWADR